MSGVEGQNGELKSTYSILNQCIKFSKITFNKFDSVHFLIIFLFHLYTLMILYNSIFKCDQTL